MSAGKARHSQIRWFQVLIDLDLKAAASDAHLRDGRTQKVELSVEGTRQKLESNTELEEARKGGERFMFLLGSVFSL